MFLTASESPEFEEVLGAYVIKTGGTWDKFAMLRENLKGESDWLIHGLWVAVAVIIVHSSQGMHS